MKLNINETLWTQFKNIVEANKAIRRIQGDDIQNEPQELVLDKSLLNDTDEKGMPFQYPWEMYHLLSKQWVCDLFGEDWLIIDTLLSVRDYDLVEIDGNFYYRESYIRSVLKILKTLANSKIVNLLRPLPQNSNKPIPSVYTSKDLMAILNVKESTLRSYRDNLLLDFSKRGDKIWYTEQNLMDFLNKTNVNNLN